MVYEELTGDVHERILVVVTHLYTIRVYLRATQNLFQRRAVSILVFLDPPYHFSQISESNQFFFLKNNQFLPIL